MSIYKPCDIRGHVSTELNPQLYRRWGYALGKQVNDGAKFVVGGDVRLSTPELLAALIEGLCQAGADVVDLGTLPTPIIYYARRRLLADACAIVTASHNPPDFNGLKWIIGGRPPTADQMDKLRQAAEEEVPSAAETPPRTSRFLDVTFDYVACQQERWVDTPAVDRNVIVEPLNGCFAGLARRYLQAIFPRIVFSAIHDTPDPVFEGRSPDCSRSENLEALCEAVDHQRADLGIALDGDGDRAAFVDNEGNCLTAEEATCILLGSFGEELPGEAFVYDLKFSDRVAETANRLGAKTLVERSGHAFIRNRMLDEGALFGAEISGHYFYRELEGGDDGLYTVCRMIDYLSRTGKSLSELRRECPKVYVTPDLRVRVEPSEQAGVIEKVASAWAQFPQTTVDGVRVNFPHGWALVRRSVTEPVLTFRFEGDGFSELNELVWDFLRRTERLGRPAVGPVRSGQRGGSTIGGKTENTKYEYRHPKQIRNPKSRMTKTLSRDPSSFGAFVFRI